jgi:glutamate dehydrogenase/leucine dehydrogenase
MTIMSEGAAEFEHEHVVLRQDPATGLRLIVAVHSTVLGPAVGGMRLRAYPGGVAEALEDVLALSRTMTLKASAAGLDLGGGKAVMLDDGCTGAREARMVAAARAIDAFGGEYVTAEDIGTTTADMDLMSRHTRYVVGRSEANGGRGDPSPVTAETVLRAMARGLAAADAAGAGPGGPRRADAAVADGGLGGRTVGIVGVGKVGAALARKLVAADARVVAYDVDERKLRTLVAEGGVEAAASADALLARRLDVLAPCAAGGMIDPALAGALDCRVVCGAANNPLTSPAVAEQLSARGILYVPDFLANCGGLIKVAAEWDGGDGAQVERHIETAMSRLDDALAESLATGATPAAVAERHALERIAAAARGGHGGRKGRGGRGDGLATAA